MAPVVIIAVSIAGAVFGEEAARGEIVGQLDDFVGIDAAQAVEEADARSRPEAAGLVPTITGLLALLAYTAPASTYGAAGSLVLILLWVYYSSLILFFGAALTKARVLGAGKAIVPRAMAVRVREEIVEETVTPNP